MPPVEPEIETHFCAECGELRILCETLCSLCNNRRSHKPQNLIESIQTAESFEEAMLKVKRLAKEIKNNP